MTDLHYKWSKIIAANQNVHGTAIKDSAEAQELVDDLEQRDRELKEAISLLRPMIDSQFALYNIIARVSSVIKLTEEEQSVVSAVYKAFTTTDTEGATTNKSTP